jgi:hypothetical protein
MKAGELGAVVAVGVAVVAGVIVLAAGLAGGSVETNSSGGTVPDPPDDPRLGVVFGSRESGGFSLLGFQIQSPTTAFEVAVIASPDCVWLDGEREQLRSTGECADVPAIGPIVGSGITSAGANFYFVLVEVSDDCSAAVAIGDRWPTGLPACK